MNRRDIITNNLMEKGFMPYYDDIETIIVQMPLPRKQRQIENRYEYYGFVKININSNKVLFIGLFVPTTQLMSHNDLYYRIKRKALRAIDTIIKIIKEARITKETVIKELEHLKERVDTDLINYLKENLK